MKILPRKVWGHAVGHGWIKLLPVSVVFVHHDVGSAPGAKATIAQESAYIRNLDAIGHSRGFAGISYNYVIAKSGRAYTARGQHVGAQNDGENSSSIGIVVLGNYEVDKATDKIVGAIGELIATLKKRGVIKKGKTVILGHRDTDSTACPGKNLYARLGDIRRIFKREWYKLRQEATTSGS